jgi:hypothetical protein
MTHPQDTRESATAEWRKSGSPTATACCPCLSSRASSPDAPLHLHPHPSIASLHHTRLWPALARSPSSQSTSAHAATTRDGPPHLGARTSRLLAPYTRKHPHSESSLLVPLRSSTLRVSHPAHEESKHTNTNQHLPQRRKKQESPDEEHYTASVALVSIPASFRPDRQ